MQLLWVFSHLLQVLLVLFYLLLFLLLLHYFLTCGTAITNVLSYFTNMLTYVPLCLDFLMIPRQAIIFLFDYYVIKYTIYLTIRAIKCALAIYNKLKP